MEEQYPSPDILDVQDDFLFGSSSEDDCTLYYYQVQKLFPVTGSPPYVVQAGTSAIQAVVFPLPEWDANKKKTSGKFYTTGVARVALPVSQSQSGHDSDEPLSVVFFCDCCEEGQLAWVDILYWFEMPGACKKSSSCLHAQYLKKLVEQYGGIEMLMSWARPAGDSRNPISVSSTHGILPRTVFCVFHHCSEIYYFSDGQQQGEEDQPGEQEGEEFVTKLCKLKLRHVIEHADLVQVCRFEDVRNPPGFLVKGNCWTCRNSSNRCYHTRVYKKHCGQPGVTVTVLEFAFFLFQCLL
jgi:hypothetical protein